MDRSLPTPVAVKTGAISCRGKTDLLLKATSGSQVISNAFDMG